MNLLCVRAGVAWLLVALTLPLLQSAPSQFLIPPIYSNGGAAIASAGDLNGDGVPDVVFANNCPAYCSFGLSIFLSNGKGSYSFQKPLAGGIHANNVVIADFNNDGRADIAVTNLGDATHPPNVFIYLGHGDGTFQSAIGVALPFTPVAMAGGDFNGDGSADLVITSSAGIQILLAKGNGSFQSPMSFQISDRFGAVVVGDFNNDHALDVAAIDYSCSCVTVLPNVNTGTFGTILFQPGNATGGLIAADFNRDGILDLAVGGVNEPSSYISENIQIEIGDGKGNFSLASNTAHGGYSGLQGGMVAADFNGDGYMDLAAASQGTIEINYGDGTGGFTGTAYYQSSMYPVPLAATDLNRDGRLDLIIYANEVGTSGATSGLSILYGTSRGNFLAPSQFPDDAEPYGYSTIASADFNHDGNLDLALSAPRPGQIYSQGVSIMMGNGKGTFVLQQPILTISGTPQALATGDFNGDGNPDIVVEDGLGGGTEKSNINVFLGNGNGSFQSVVITQVPFIAQQFLVADFNRDGKQDLLVLGAEGNVHVLISTGSGKFVASGAIAATGAAVGDVNGDGFLDIVISSPAATQILFGNANGTFQAPKPYPSLSGTLVLADLNGDGRPDIVGCGGVTSVMLNLGAGRFGPVVSTSLTNYAFTANCAITDLNGDGKPDVVLPGQYGFLYALGNGDGSFQNPIVYGSFAQQSGAILVSDVNGDNAPDVVLAQNGLVSVIANSGVR